MKDKIKYQFAEAIKQCMKKSTLDKITVMEICMMANLTRQTFYRHFKDKYDLVNWYFEKILRASFQQMGNGKTIDQALVNKFRYIEQEKMFFKVAFMVDSQNNLREYDFQLIMEFYRQKIEMHTHCPLDQHTQFLLEMYCQGSIYMTLQWILGKQEFTPEQLSKELIAAMPLGLRQIFVKLRLLVL